MRLSPAHPPRSAVGAVALTEVSERFRVELLVSRALLLQARDAKPAAEQQRWPDRPGDGIPTTTVPDRPTADESHRARFGLSSLEDRGRDVEVAETRTALRNEVLGGLGEPLLLVRVGWQAIGRSQLVRTPRRRLADVLLP